MKKRKRTGCAVYGLVLWLGISLIFGNVGLRVYGAEEQSNSLAIESPGAFLMEASTGTVIYEKDADTRRSPASVTKIMTALLIFENLEKGKIQLTDEVVTSAHAKSMGGSADQHEGSIFIPLHIAQGILDGFLPLQSSKDK